MHFISTKNDSPWFCNSLLRFSTVFHIIVSPPIHIKICIFKSEPRLIITIYLILAYCIYSHL